MPDVLVVSEGPVHTVACTDCGPVSRWFSNALAGFDALGHVAHHHQTARPYTDPWEPPVPPDALCAEAGCSDPATGWRTDGLWTFTVCTLHLAPPVTPPPPGA